MALEGLPQNMNEDEPRVEYAIETRTELATMRTRDANTPERALERSNEQLLAVLKFIHGRLQKYVVVPPSASSSSSADAANTERRTRRAREAHKRFGRFSAAVLVASASARRPTGANFFDVAFR